MTVNDDARNELLSLLTTIKNGFTTARLALDEAKVELDLTILATAPDMSDDEIRVLALRCGADYCAYEYLGERSNLAPVARVPFWSDLIDGAGGVQFW